MEKFRSICHNNMSLRDDGRSHQIGITVNKEYKVEVELNNMGIVYQIYDNGSTLGYLTDLDFCDFFYTPAQMRDIKLNKILNV